jgi:multicomponent Na+:H+ antiporter subunit B
MLEIYILLILMIIGSVLALESKELLSAVILTGAVGLCLSAAFLLLKAPDLAMTQLIIEIVLMIILVRATISFDLPLFKAKQNFGFLACVFTGILGFLSAAAYLIEKLPIFGNPLMRISRTYLAEALFQTKAANLVAAITLDYRVFDTFLAMVSLFVAVIAIITITRQNANKTYNKNK